MIERNCGSSARTLRCAASQCASVRTGACSPTKVKPDCGFAANAEPLRSATGAALLVNPVMRKYSTTAAVVVRLGNKSRTRRVRIGGITIGSRWIVPNEPGVPDGSAE